MNILKLLALGLGGYLLIRNTKLFTKPPPGANIHPTTLPPGAEMQPTTPPPPPLPPPKPTPPGGFSAAEKVTLFKRAAIGDQEAGGQIQAQGWKLSADEWNFYRVAAGGGETTVDLFPEGQRGYLMTAAEYLKRRADAGLSGMGWRWSY